MAQAHHPRSGAAAALTPPFPPRPQPRSYVRVAPKHEQRSGLMWPAYIYNVSQSLLRQDIAAFFDGYNLPEEEIRWVGLAQPWWHIPPCAQAGQRWEQAEAAWVAQRWRTRSGAARRPCLARGQP